MVSYTHPPVHTPSIPMLVENPRLLDELETEDLLSLRVALQDDDDPALDGLWTLVLNRTGSFD